VLPSPTSQYTSQRRLRQQAISAHRRLQELLFECIGELAKASSRSTMQSADTCAAFAHEVPAAR
jgi:hypothetical protein